MNQNETHAGDVEGSSSEGSRQTSPRARCEYSGLGLIDDGTLPKTSPFNGRCECGAVVTITNGQFPWHDRGVDYVVGGISEGETSMDRSTE